MKVLVILSRFPYPLEKGDKLRAFQHLQMLASEHDVYLAAISDSPVSDAQISSVKPFCKEILVIRHSLWDIAINLLNGWFRKLPLQVAYFYSAKTKSRILKFQKRVNPDLVYCQLIRTALYGRDLNVPCKIIDYQDAFSAGTAQRLSQSPLALRFLFRRELRLVRKFEKDSYAWFSKHLVISEADRDQLQVPDTSKVEVLVNGIDVDQFFSSDPQKNIDLLFVGNMQYPPNVDAAVFLVEQIMPLIWEKRKDIKLVLCGADPAKEVRALASDRVTVTGWVEDVKQYYQAARVFIAPMRIGTGLQNKLLEAMACGIPCVTTPISAAPLGGQHRSELMVGASPEQLADGVLELFGDEKLRNVVGGQGNRYVRDSFSFRSVAFQLNAFLKK